MGVRWGGCLLEIVETIVLTAVIFFGFQHFVGQPYQIEQFSMERTVEPGQYVLVDKLSPNWSDYKRGDVIVFDPPAGFEEEQGKTIPFIKRVIGVAGDVVEIKNDAVFVNGAKLEEPYVYDNQATTALTTTDRWLVPKGELFVLGDHRQASQDSRVFGPIARSTVIGRAFLRYWPADALGILSGASYPNVPLTPAPALLSPAASPK